MRVRSRTANDSRGCEGACERHRVMLRATLLTGRVTAVVTCRAVGPRHAWKRKDRVSGGALGSNAASVTCTAGTSTPPVTHRRSVSRRHSAIQPVMHSCAPRIAHKPRLRRVAIRVLEKTATASHTCLQTVRVVRRDVHRVRLPCLQLHVEHRPHADDDLPRTYTC